LEKLGHEPEIHEPEGERNGSAPEGSGTGDDFSAGRAGYPASWFPERSTPGKTGKLVCLMRAGRIVHHAIVAGAPERNQRLLQEPGKQELGKQETAVLPGHVDRPIDMAAKCSTQKKT
jgi:hypothetical protein